MAEPSPSRVQRGATVLGTVAALVVVIAGLSVARPVLLPLLMAVLLSILVAPAVQWLDRRGLPTWLSVALTVAGLMGLLAGFGTLLVASVNNFSTALPHYKVRLAAMMDTLTTALAGFGIPLSLDNIYGELEPGTVIETVGNTLNGLLVGLGNLTLTLVTMVFILMEAAGFSRKVERAVDEPGPALERWALAARNVQKYLGVKTAVSAVTGLGVYLWASLLGVDFAVLWGLTAFLLNYIPAIGSIIAAVPAVLVCTVQLGPGYALALAAGYVLLNLLLGNIIEPMLQGRRLGLSPLVVFVSLVFWGWLWGPLGMLLSVPMTMVLKLTFEHSRELSWVAVLLGPAYDQVASASSPRRTVADADPVDAPSVELPRT
ncbi:MAG: AI-2E family transporter [Myxococcota bacterium]